MDFFDRVKELVKQKNTTIEDFLKDVFQDSTTRATYNTWRRRGTLPRADQAMKMAEALDTTVEYLLTGKKADTWNPPTRYADIVALLDEMDDSGLEAVRALAEGHLSRQQQRAKREA